MAALFTLFLQALGAALQLLFGLLALAASRQMSAIMLVHNLIGAPCAYFSGPGTRVYEAYLRWAPVGNHSRGLLITGYGAVLLLLYPTPHPAGG